MVLTVAQILSYSVSAAFVLLGLVAVVVWLRSRDARRGYLALALGMLGVAAVIGPLQTLTGYHEPWLIWVTLPAFQLSGFGLLMFRHKLIPLSRWALVLAAVTLTGTAALVAYLGTAAPATTPSAEQSVAVLLLIIAWSVCVAEPAFRLLQASFGRPVVQRRRLRALSLGYLGIILILLVSAIPQSGAVSSSVSVATSLVALFMVPVLYAGFSPPAWLRGVWRAREEEDFRDAVNDLLLYARTRAELAERALPWVVRLVGADFAFIIDGDGAVLAVHGTTLESAGEQAARLESQGLLRAGPEVAASGALIFPMPLERGTGYLAAFAGPFTPIFGAEETSRLRLYAASLTAALDRAQISERLLALEDAKTRFLKIASHELRGPLTLVKGYLSMMEDGTIPAGAPPQILNIMLSKVDQMSSMLTQMLETSRMEDHRTDLREERFDLREAVAEVLEEVRPTTDVRHEIEASIPDLPIEVVADRERVALILSNIVDNAIKYSPRGGRVAINVASSNGTAIVAVKDEGIGIAEEDMGQLFTRFGRIANDATTAIPGTGLGLYLARELARMHHGDVEAESEEGAGSVFTLQLPLAGAA
ncbi:MAG: HAMP domain-containing sensor histidine kinase [Candidatus Dormiibacterota bacterium]